MFQRELLPLIWICALLLIGCEARLGPAPPEKEPAPGDSATPTPGSASPFAQVEDGCVVSDKLEPHPLRRLTNREVEATVGDVFYVEAPEAQTFQDDEKTAGFAANWVSAAGDKHIEDYEEAAQAIAERVLLNDPGIFRVCPGSGLEAGSATCVTERVGATVEAAYRRPAEEDELDALLQFHASSAALYGDVDADRMLLEVILQSPQFLYVTPPYSGAEQASLASRLSYFLTAAPPDLELRARAEDGSLADEVVLEGQVERLLATDRFRDALLSFFTQWLDVERVAVVAKDTSQYPSWDETLREEMLTETELFVDMVLAQGGGLRELLTSGQTVVSPLLADLYGVADQHPGSGWHAVDLPVPERAGLLTQASFLTGHSHQVDPSWVLRGDFVRRHMLCDELPPPPDVDQSVPNDAGRLDDPSCRGCHLMMDPIGRSFDRYDAIGQYRELSPAGDVIATDGELFPGTEPLDITGAFDSPFALAQSLSASASVETCMTRQMFRFAERRRDAEHERCGLVGIAQGFSEVHGDLKMLMQAIATSPAFTHSRLDL